MVPFPPSADTQACLPLPAPSQGESKDTSVRMDFLMDKSLTTLPSCQQLNTQKDFPGYRTKLNSPAANLSQAIKRERD